MDKKNEIDIFFVVQTETIAQQRPRFARVGDNVKTYDPEQCKQYKEFVAWSGKSKAPREPFKDPLIVDITVFQQIPKSWSAIKKAKALNRDILPTTRPDIDNLCKGILDGCNGLFWVDDAQIIELRARKLYSITPYAEIRIRSIFSDCKRWVSPPDYIPLFTR